MYTIYEGILLPIDSVTLIAFRYNASTFCNELLLHVSQE